MNKFFSLIIAGVLCTSNVLAQSFKDYYTPVDGLKKETLKSELSKLLNKHQVFSYASLWDHYPYTDGCLDNEDQVFDMYSTEEFYFSKHPTSAMSIHQSRGLTAQRATTLLVSLMAMHHSRMSDAR